MDGKNTGHLPRGSAEWLREMAERDRFLVTRAGRYTGNQGHSNDAWLNVRRHLEHRWRLDPACPPAAGDYRQAAHLLERAGEPQLAAVLDGIAGTGAELDAAARAWTSRYATRHSTMEETLAGWLRDGVLRLDEGLCWPGADGSTYQTGAFGSQPGRPGDPVVLVTTMTTRELVAGFGGEQPALAWLRDRYRAGHAKPLADPAVEHLPRVTLEEHLLAWLLHHPGQLGDVAAALPGPVWTADCRHEIYAALRTAAGRDKQAGYSEVSAELGRRLLRAPGWAASQVGWPSGNWAQQYLQRLAATTIPGPAAREATRALAIEEPDTTASPGTGAVSRQGAGRAAVPGHHRPAAPQADTARRAAVAHLQQMGPPLARPDSFGARVRIQPPRP